MRILMKPSWNLRFLMEADLRDAWLLNGESTQSVFLMLLTLKVHTVGGRICTALDLFKAKCLNKVDFISIQ